jgi:hypothetical protein
MTVLRHKALRKMTHHPQEPRSEPLTRAVWGGIVLRVDPVNTCIQQVVLENNREKEYGCVRMHVRVHAHMLHLHAQGSILTFFVDKQAHRWKLV